MGPVEVVHRLHFDDHAPIDEKVNAEITDHDILEVNPHRSFALDFNPCAFEHAGHRLLVHGLHETVSEPVVYMEEGAENLPCGVALDQSFVGHGALGVRYPRQSA